VNPLQIQPGGPSGFDGTPSAPIAPAAAGPGLAPLLAPGFVQGVDRGGLNETLRQESLGKGEGCRKHWKPFIATLWVESHPAEPGQQPEVRLASARATVRAKRRPPVVRPGY
jgi:hypothetical protein